MELEDTIILVNRLLRNQPLNSVEEKVLRECLEDKTYQTIAQNLGYTHDYIRVLGSSILKRLSDALGQEIKKSNVCEILSEIDLTKLIKEHTNFYTTDLTNLYQPKYGFDCPEELKYPDGIIPLTSILYIQRPWLEVRCYDAIVQKEPLIRLKSPQKTGKSSLLTRILNFAQHQGFKTISLSFKLVSQDQLTDSNSFVKWFCAVISQKLNIPHQINYIWDDIFGANYNATNYFEQYILPEIKQPIILGLDDVDLIFEHHNVAKDFLTLLRAWFEKVKLGDLENENWQKISFIIVHSTESYFPLNWNSSPFNVGLSIKLPNFTLEEVEELIWLCGTTVLEKIKKKNWQKLIDLVGGNPYLIRIFFYHLTQDKLDADQMLNEASSVQGIYQKHLTFYFNYLISSPHLSKLYYQIVTSKDAIKLSSQEAFKLDSLGLITLNKNYAIPRCELYRQYFRNALE